MDNQENTFRYTYSTAERTELESIRKKYLPQEEAGMDRIRRLDRSASQKAQTWALALGILGALILGSGMSLFMTELGTALGLGTHSSMVGGIATGILGIVLIALAYPTYNRVLRLQRQRIAPEILRLTEDLMQ